jgi:RNA polymerase II subunit A small phosphatase-like protein
VYDFTVPVLLQNTISKAYVAKRPGVDKFLAKAAEHFEVVIFTASLKSYADPLIDILAPGLTLQRLFRRSCRYIDGAYIKDLHRLGRDLNKVVIVDVTLM